MASAHAVHRTGADHDVGDHQCLRHVASSFFGAKFQRNIEELLVRRFRLTSLLPDMSAVAWRVVVCWHSGDGNFTVFCAISGASWVFVALTLVLTAVLFSLAGC